MKQVVVIDGKYLAYKMHFAHLGLQTTDRRPTGMLHGFLGELLRINRKLPGAKIIICWDGAGDTWRHKVFSGYKGNRKENPEMKRMMPQIKSLLTVLRKMGLWVLQVDGVEADDMIGMVSTVLAAQSYEVRIYSKDRDMFQLVNDYIWIWHDLNLAPLRRSDIEKWLGVPFRALLDVRAMAGDPGDNLHGLKGVGYITAVKLWKQGLRVADVSNAKLWSKYKDQWQRVRFEYELAKIITDPLSVVWPRRTSRDLYHLLQKVVQRPGRAVDMAEEHRREVYMILGQYELNTLLQERHKFFRLP